MSQLFFGKPAPTFQSCHHHPSSPTDPEQGHGPDQDIPDETFSFVTLDESHGQQSEDSGIDISNISNRRDVHNSTSSELPGEESTTVLSSTIEEIGKKAQDLIERINQSRAMDQEIMTTFENKLMNKVSEVCQQVKEQMFSSYEEHGRGMEANLQELSEVLERSSQLSMELQGASQTLSAINNSLQQTAEN
ncbi:synaptonemal complex central element protein 2 [Salmo salar]|uniref:Synaptonemal complex central element protein 2 n=1 Tax=Salmo salar TaxID=8030 RepID=A0A1S3RAU7_SALSA|nr:synaptonemal complex central element protein 2 [Salmo salar]|eukprot:XP_014048982.1 PREDICTED: synaptonemal complex central element protein 2-like [Salmo salar]